MITFIVAKVLFKLLLPLNLILGCATLLQLAMSLLQAVEEFHTAHSLFFFVFFWRVVVTLPLWR